MIYLESLVIYTKDVEKARLFFSALGFETVPEKHGNGPKHYSMQFGNDVLLEIYPGSPSSARYGLRVSSLSTVLLALGELGYGARDRQDEPGRHSALITDFEGRRFALSSTLE